MARPKADSTRINLYMDNKVLSAIKKLADHHNTSYSEVIRKASQQYVIRELTRLREAQASRKAATSLASSSVEVPDDAA